MCLSCVQVLPGGHCLVQRQSLHIDSPASMKGLRRKSMSIYFLGFISFNGQGSCHMAAELLGRAVAHLSGAASHHFNLPNLFGASPCPAAKLIHFCFLSFWQSFWHQDLSSVPGSSVLQPWGSQEAAESHVHGAGREQCSCPPHSQATAQRKKNETALLGAGIAELLSVSKCH